MKNPQPQQRQRRGTVGVESRQGKLRLRLPRTIAEVNARYISTGLDDTPENQRKAQVIAWQIEEDIQAEQLDVTLEKYRHHQQASTVLVVKPKPLPDLRELWQAYCEYREPLVSVTTFKQKYIGYFASHINKLPSHKLNDATNIRHYICSNYSADTAKRVLTQLSACCNWAVNTGIIANNPFIGMTVGLRRSWNSDNIDPFTRSERDSIIDAFSKHSTYSHYTPLITFLFATGCRPGEAAALRWKHVTREYVLFSENYKAKYKLTKEPKNGKARRFPVNTQLSQLLTTVQPATQRRPDAFVFITHYHKQQLNNDTLPTATGWKSIVNELVDQGLVARYRPPYNTRHTFITLALNAGLTVPQVAKLVGNTPAIILKHYASGHVSEVPVF
ncbi:hypothetical protein A6770_28450 [Nostoc minutum NIES-26]|uniref:Tyr recombinase domain-containing protein n=1 Tax=Nostoc minutum NIES-26 TaxID=1844469 RepID=A0A367QKN6_9NOSO|nr:hypothetical protein A6770_28450 [Nostoc minutum NIES-26]